MDRTQRITLVATGLGLFMIFLDALIVNVALPSIQAAFAVGEDGLQWVVAAYSLGMAVFIMTAATLADLHGRRRWYISGITVFTLASIVCGVAPVVPDPAERQGIASKIVSSANPRAQVAEIVPRRPFTHPDPAVQKAIRVAADRDFVQGIRAGLLLAVVLLIIALLIGWRLFPRGTGALREAEREEARLAPSEK